MPNSHLTPAGLSAAAPFQELENEGDFKPPIGLKLFLFFFVLLGGIILLDTVSSLFR